MLSFLFHSSESRSPELSNFSWGRLPACQRKWKAAHLLCGDRLDAYLSLFLITRIRTQDARMKATFWRGDSKNDYAMV